MRLTDSRHPSAIHHSSGRYAPAPPLAGQLAVALASGGVLTLAFPEPDVFPLAWLALAPVLLVTRACTVRRGLVVWFVFGLAFMGTLLYWISIVGWAAWAALVLMESIYFGAFGAGWAIASRHRIVVVRVIAAAALWVALEYLRSIVPVVGFTWGELAQSQHNAPFLLRVSAYGGGWAVAFLLVAVNALVAEAWRSIGDGRWGRGVAEVLASSILLAAPILIPANEAGGNTMRVAIVQGNVPRNFVGDVREKELRIIASHKRLTEELIREEPDLVVWPESSVGLDPLENEAASSELREAAQAVDAPMLVGGNMDVGTDRYQVKVFEVSPRGEIVDSYQKRHLVAFGEFVPARDLFSWIPMLDQVPRDAIPGRDPKVFDLPQGPVATVISFEGDFGSLVRESVAEGGRLLIVATNTSTWGESWASAQHVAFSQVRAAENGVWVVHGALSGISGFIDPEGRVLDSTTLWTATSVVREVRFSQAATFYARTGDWVPWGSTVLGLLLVAWALVARPTPVRR